VGGLLIASSPICPLWTFVVVVFLWRMMVGFSAESDRRAPDSHLGSVHLVEKPTNRLVRRRCHRRHRGPALWLQPIILC
jgi:hypothetical protein